MREMTFARMEALARDVTESVLASLPAEIAAEVSRAEIFFERRPNRQDIEEGADADLLGYFDPGPSDMLAPRIRLWLQNLWDYSEGDGETFREEIRITLLHEIGHLLGWDEDEVAERGLD